MSAKQEKKGLFILVKTSNPSSGEFQDQLIDGKPLYELVGEKVAQWGEEHMGDGYSYIGAVVGATYPEQGEILRKVMPKSFILVPGYGAQGGKGKDLVHFFNEDGLGAIVNSSRGIIAAYKQEAYAKFGAENFGDASRAGSRGYDRRYSGLALHLRSRRTRLARRENRYEEQRICSSSEQTEIASGIFSLWLQTEQIAKERSSRDSSYPCTAVTEAVCFHVRSVSVKSDAEKESFVWYIV